jgi:hypothetical protein
MHDLNQLQRWMQTVIMCPGGAPAGVASAQARGIIDVTPEAVESVATPSRALSALERLDIYNRSYFTRLLECLREEFPVLRHAIGEEAFDHFALDYLGKYPSHSYTLNDLGTSFPAYLAESRPADDRVEVTGLNLPDFLIDLVTLEQTYGDVFDGPGVEGQRLLDLEQLAKVSPESWPEARMVPVCCLRLLALRYPVHRYFSAVRRKKEPTFPRPAKTYLAVTRRDFVVRRYVLSRVQYVLLEGLSSGQAIGDAIFQAAKFTRLDTDALAGRLRTWFRNWTAEGFFLAMK